MHDSKRKPRFYVNPISGKVIKSTGELFKRLRGDKIKLDKDRCLYNAESAARCLRRIEILYPDVVYPPSSMKTIPKTYKTGRTRGFIVNNLYVVAIILKSGEIQKLRKPIRTDISMIPRVKDPMQSIPNVVRTSSIVSDETQKEVEDQLDHDELLGYPESTTLIYNPAQNDFIPVNRKTTHQEDLDLIGSINDTLVPHALPPIVQDGKVAGVITKDDQIVGVVDVNNNVSKLAEPIAKSDILEPSTPTNQMPPIRTTRFLPLKSRQTKKPETLDDSSKTSTTQSDTESKSDVSSMTSFLGTWFGPQKEEKVDNEKKTFSQSEPETVITQTTQTETEPISTYDPDQTKSIGTESNDNETIRPVSTAVKETEPDNITTGTELTTQTEPVSTQTATESIGTETESKGNESIDNETIRPVSTVVKETEPDNITTGTELTTQTEPVSIQPATESIGTETEPITTETELVSTETEPITTETGLVSTETESIGTETESIGTETESIGTETESIGTETESIGTETTTDSEEESTKLNIPEIKAEDLKETFNEQVAMTSGETSKVLKELKCIDGEQLDANKTRCLPCSEYNLVWDPLYKMCKISLKPPSNDVIIVNERDDIIGYM